VKRDVPRTHRLAAYQHFLSVNMGVTLQAQIQDVLDRQRGIVRQGVLPSLEAGHGQRAVLASASR
jgi:hypothetical protein